MITAEDFVVDIVVDLAADIDSCTAVAGTATEFAAGTGSAVAVEKDFDFHHRTGTVVLPADVCTRQF